jgi:hypothetical protein
MLTFLSSIPSEVFDAIGIAGFGIYVLNYGLLTFKRIGSETTTYFVLNWFAATAVLIGLTTSFNLASALIQIFWIVISTVAIIIRLRHSKTQPDNLADLHEKLTV